MKTKSSPRIIETNERIVKKRITKCTSCKYVYEEMDVFVIPRLREVVSREKNGIKLADEQKLEDAKNFYKNYGYIDEYYMKYVKLAGKYHKGEPIFEKKQRLYEAKDKFMLYKIKNEETGKEEKFLRCPHCGTMIEYKKALQTKTIRENQDDIYRSERTHVIME